MLSGDPAARLDLLTDLATPLAVRTAVTLRVPEKVAGGTTKLDDLATACAADRDALGRLLRYLAHRGVFVEVSPDVFGLTEVGELLCDRSAGGYGTRLDLDGLAARLDLAVLGLPHAVRSGGPGYAAVHGRELWADLDATPEFRAHFDELMESLQRTTAPEVAARYPWPEIGTVADVGGGSGALLAELLTAHPHLRGILVDRAEPVATAARRFADRGLADRVELVAGDFFQPLPPGADVYLISRALTDWNDGDATAILRRCAEAAGPDGRILIVEVLPTEPHVPHLSSYDLRMLVEVGGRERGLDDYVVLAAAAGLAPRRNFRGAAGLTLMEFG
ncbi:methyltransferase [Actinophytocola sp.]|uniref:methyltransferase n=1 Tax=Actinophytocola sp. TaxID=1872138 RepID=UPI002D7F72C2|nr:methyltransferase [Actinophytocola sp.]HET9143130.1 methyltransferase [Actinophytocola sp.]